MKFVDAPDFSRNLINNRAFNFTVQCSGFRATLPCSQLLAPVQALSQVPSYLSHPLHTPRMSLVTEFWKQKQFSSARWTRHADKDSTRRPAVPRSIRITRSPRLPWRTVQASSSCVGVNLWCNGVSIRGKARSSSDLEKCGENASEDPIPP